MDKKRRKRESAEKSGVDVVRAASGARGCERVVDGMVRDLQGWCVIVSNPGTSGRVPSDRSNCRSEDATFVITL